MDNNQFKKVLRGEIESQVENSNMKCYYVDRNNRERLYYVFNLDNEMMGSINIFLGDKDCSIQYTKGEMISTVKCDVRLKAPYIKLKDLLKFIFTAVDDIDNYRIKRRDEKC